MRVSHPASDGVSKLHPRSVWKSPSRPPSMTARMAAAVARWAPLGALTVALGCADPNAAVEETWVNVARDDLVVEVDVTGTLRATRSSQVGPPSLSDTWDFKIVKMAPEGTEAKKGTPVLFFDSSELERQLVQRQSERDAAAQEIVKKKIDLDLARREGEMRVGEAEAAVRKAQLKGDLPAQYTAAVEVKLAKIELESAEAELQMARRRLDYTTKLGEAELGVLRDRHGRAQARLDQIQDAMKRLTVAAPSDGLVVYRSSWRGEKKKVGDSCWAGEACVEVVDTSEMMGKGEVDETESARVAAGQRATFRLEALPEMEWQGTVERIRPTVYRQSPRNPLKVIGLDLKLDRTDRVRMRPGMLFRGRIETARVPRALLVPLDAIFVRAQGPVAFRRTSVGWEKVRLELGKRNGRHAEVLGGLSEGDHISRRDLEREGEGS